MTQSGNVLLTSWQKHSKYNDNSSRFLTKSPKTFIGIDFGTSTTVVSVISKRNGGNWSPQPLQIAQPMPGGGVDEDAIINSVLAWKNDRLFFGKPAYKIMRSNSKGAGKTTFSSFKMNLGINIGPTYPKSSLSEVNNHGVVIETAKQATAEFFKLLVPRIEQALKEEGLPPTSCYAVSVPASFQASQRRELREALAEAGIQITENCFIDEPNAAFLSYFFESSSGTESSELVEQLEQRPLNILVYDFGAGTCDVSILKIELKTEAGQRKFMSQNRAISRFTALGGNNIDRAIAEKVLLPQLLDGNEDLELTQSYINDTLIPFLLPTAEGLKIAFCQWMADKGINTCEELAEEEHTVSGKPLETTALKRKLELDRPTMSASQFSEVMEEFSGEFDEDEATNHAYGPVDDALGKAGIEPEDLYGVLFIGGSCGNPIILDAIMRELPSSVQKIVPADLRCHVSQGAALHSATYHGFGDDLIRPVTSEPICLITQGKKLEVLLSASTPLPSEPVTTTVKVAENMQDRVELPICLSSPQRLLGKLDLLGGAVGFERGSLITVKAWLTHEKILHVQAECEGRRVESIITNPLSCESVSPEETEYLLAKKDFNEAMLLNKITAPIIRKMVRACEKCGKYLEVCDYLRWLEKYEKEDHATNLCYYYSKAGDQRSANRWSNTAYHRKPSALNAYNCACGTTGQEKIKFLRESLEKDPEFVLSLWMLGKIMARQGAPEGIKMARKAARIWKEELSVGNLSKTDAIRLLEMADLLGDADLKQLTEDYLSSLKTNKNTFSPYEEDNLAISISHNAVTER